MKRLVTLYLIMLSLTLSCSSDPSPSQSELKQSLAVNLPAFVEINTYSIEASQNAGTKVEPIHQSRFKAVFVIKSDLYLDAGTEGSVLFVRQHKKQGDTIEIFGKSESRLFAGQWNTNVQLDGDPLRTLGKPLSLFSASRVIVKGSDDESAYYAEIDRIKKDNNEAARKAAEERAVLSTKIRQTLAGLWQTESDLSFEYHKDGTFTEFQKGKKKHDGKWRIHDGQLIIIGPTGKEFIYDVIFYSNNVYKIKDDSGIYTSNRIR